MNAKLRSIEIDEATAELLEARAAIRGLSIAELLADLAANEAGLSDELSAQRAAGEGPWSEAALQADAQRLEAFREERLGIPWTEARSWLERWGEDGAVTPPPVRKL